MSLKLTVKKGPNAGEVFTIEDQTQTIGRGSANDIVIVERTLSRQHARIKAGPEDGFVIEDLGSANGTFVNGQRITGPTTLRSGDTLRLGEVVTFSAELVQLVSHPVEDNVKVPVDDDATLVGAQALNPQTSPIKLMMQNGPNPGQVFAIEGQNQAIGRGSGNDIVITERSLSRQHARIKMGPDGFMVEDLDSSNGTFVNGQRVGGPTPLRPGDTLQLGEGVTFSVQADQMPTPMASYVPPPAPVAPLTTPPPTPATTPQPSAWPVSPLVLGGGVAVLLIVILALAGGLYYYFLAGSDDTQAQASLLTAQPEATATPLEQVAPASDLATNTPTSAPTFTPTPEPPTPTPALDSGSDSLTIAATDTPTSEPPTLTPTPEPTATLTPTPGSVSVPPTATPSPTSEQIQVSAPKLVEYNGQVFMWEWAGKSRVEDVDWYFDVKIFANAFSEFPYDVLVAEPESTGFAHENVWEFAGSSNFQCGSHWAVQIAKRNPDGTYAGPLSPESDRLPIPIPGCGGSSSGGESEGSGGGSSSGGGGGGSCPGCP